MKTMPFTFIFYVSNVAASCHFYSKILECKAIEGSANFGLFPLHSGGLLGLWARSDVKPDVASLGTGGELAFKVETPARVDELYKQWVAEKVTIAQRPTEMDFGYTFTALDPDGHRVRVMALRPM